MERPLTPAPDVTFREATDADHPRLARLIRQWWDERPPRVERLWFRHFGPTSVVGETTDGAPLAVAIGFRGANGVGGLHLVAVARGVRRRGVGRAAVAAVEGRLAGAGAGVVEAVVWPGNRVGVRFLDALGYESVEAARRTPLYGVPAIADYDGEGEDRAVFRRSIGGVGGAG